MFAVLVHHAVSDDIMMESLYPKHRTMQELLGRKLTESELKNSPGILYLKGKDYYFSYSLQQNLKKVAVIGTREPTQQAIEDTKKVVRELLDKNAIIMSGLAIGIDTAAHEEAILRNGKTIAVLGTPLNRFYPKQNIWLQQEIMSNQLAVSQFETNHYTIYTDFPARDLTLALLSDIVIIMEAKGERNGSLYACWEAIRLGRPLYIWKNILMNQRLKWPTELIKYGAKVLNNLEEVKYLVK